jgi:hypothetical protein
MSNALNTAELAAQQVELLPARTVLSMLHPSGIEITGPKGDPGVAGANGQGSRSFNLLEYLSPGSDPLTPGTTNGSPA